MEATNNHEQKFVAFPGVNLGYTQTPLAAKLGEI
jgi:hypothetical protein